MSEYDNTNTGALFTNDKQGNEKRPDSKGTLNVGGVEYWISGWRKTSNAGKPFLSLKVEQKEKQPAPAPGGRQDPPQPGPDDSGEPFPF